MTGKTATIELTATFQVTVAGKTLKLTTGDVSRIVKGHERAMAKVVAAKKVADAKAKKAALVAQKLASAQSRKVDAAQVTRVTKKSQVLVELVAPIATNAQERKAQELLAQKVEADRDWAKAYTQAFNEAVADGKYVGKANADDIARSNAALSAHPLVKAAATKQAHIAAQLVKSPKGQRLTYKEICESMARRGTPAAPATPKAKKAA
jgi:flagellar biosynthesis/type III secretory pathway protein FliH